MIVLQQTVAFVRFELSDSLSITFNDLLWTITIAKGNRSTLVDLAMYMERDNNNKKTD